MRTHPLLAQTIEALQKSPRRWLVTGAAGFIGSHLVEQLLQMNQKVAGIDNFATGYKKNLDDIQARVRSALWKNFEFFEDDICNFESCQRAARGAQVVLHHAALGSVPRSIANPQATNAVNVGGTINVLMAAKEQKDVRVISASSSSVYGDNDDLPKVESRTGRPLSPYAVSKAAGELYAKVFSEVYNLEIISLRYFNVFGGRQNRLGPYAAVIPQWITALMSGEDIIVHGDGSTSRDFCYVKNVVQMNLLAATTNNREAFGQVFNTAFDAKTSLTELLSSLQRRVPDCKSRVIHQERRPGDISHSQASIELARRLLGYQPQYDIQAGLDETVEWYRGSRS